MPSYSDAALVLVGHGSTVNPDSSAPTRAHAAELGRRGLFREVVACFWKEEPPIREVYGLIESDRVYVVPLFISEGYFTRTVLPRELDLDGPVTRRGSRTICYTDPVGNDPRMTGALLKRAREIAPGVPEEQTTLLIVGHGTTRDANSARAAANQAQLIAERTRYASVRSAYMEEEPLVSRWHEWAQSPHVVVVPFFISDGLHSYQDIPVLLGIEPEAGPAASRRDVFRHNPHRLRGKDLYYAGAIGTEPMMADVILDLVEAFDRTHGWPPKPPGC